ncbi:efflux RND transporter periplasmic adaptor subunit [Flavihumibacter solisilvae]|uniref:Secretion protein HylD n=1 Tax=Flavihumibacter solisilvae TaxID=1349421 RepID=A0A0C1L5Z4_9BACT|nr:efflux RND transporter periplasmic adaptor subunit [Flavihumibacter solisilvae]KIC94956.1 secretion protein HylD [Flavihumibacter solisilvae]
MSGSFRSLRWLVFFAIAGCTANSAENNTKDVPEIPVINLADSDTTLYTGYVANIQAVQHVEIRAKVKGFLDRILVDEGAIVKKGEVLFRINGDEYSNAVAKSKAQLANAHADAQAAELEVKRVKLLVEKNVLTSSELKLAEVKLMAEQAKIREALSASELAELQLSYTAIRAPFDGIVNRMPLKVGSLLDEGTLLTTISDNHAVYAYFKVSEIEYLDLARNDQEKLGGNSTVQMIMADGLPYDSKGKIETTEGEIDRSTGSLAIRAKFPNPDRILKHGATGRVKLSNAAHDIVTVPQKSVFEVQDKHFVFVVDNSNRIRQRSFEPERRLASSYIVASGLKAGDKIVYEGIQHLRDGMVIKPRYTVVKL